jgi:hypothetical protein
MRRILVFCREPLDLKLVSRSVELDLFSHTGLVKILALLVPAQPAHDCLMMKLMLLTKLPDGYPR